MGNCNGLPAGDEEPRQHSATGSIPAQTNNGVRVQPPENPPPPKPHSPTPTPTDPASHHQHHAPSIPRPLAGIGRVLGRPMEDVRATYTFGRELGRGQFGVTYLCTHRETKQVFACKSIATRKLITKDDIEDVRREVQIMHHLTGHRNIVELKGTYEDRQSVNLVMELCAGGELFDRIIAKGHYSERAAAALCREMVTVVHNCHSMGVMHRDLKPENFLFLDKSETSPLKATDFGLSVFFKPGEVFKDLVGSAYYVAPEVLRRPSSCMMFGSSNHFSSMATGIDVAVAARLSFLLMVLQIFSICARSSSSNISLGSSLFPDPNKNQSSYWLSPSGIFAFGFYSLSGYSTPSFVVGIWHEKPSEKTLVWVANRDEPPFTARGISLLLTQTGELVVRNYFSGEEKPISNTTRAAARASMLDSGNFVLYDFNSKIIWESFVSPTDTILGDQRRKNSQVLLQSQMVSPPVNSHHLQVSDQTHTKWFVISMVLASTLLVYVALSCFWILKSCSRIQIYREFTAKVTDGVNLRRFTYRELYEATGGFREELGSGGLGTVYRGFLFSSVEIAVKKLNKEQGETEFQTEMNIISRIHHRNLIRLLGFCFEGSYKLLVYEFMKNGSLADLLFRAERKPEWDERVRISIDIARALSYLHEEFETQIIHGDIKPGNILLNDSWVPKISGFGLSKLLEPCQTRTTVTDIEGTFGYIAPELFRNVPITCRVDVYSFGMMLFEIICCRPTLVDRDVRGNKMVDHDAPANKIFLSNWVYDCFAGGELEKLVAPHEVDSGIDMRSLKKMVIVGMWCIQADPSLRPTMGRVVSMLEGNVDIMAPPHPTRG